MSLRRAKELGLEFTTESMVKALYKSQANDMEVFYDGPEHEWVVRWHHQPGMWTLPEDEWGAVVRGKFLREVLEEAVHGVFFS